MYSHSAGGGGWPPARSTSGLGSAGASAAGQSRNRPGSAGPATLVDLDAHRAALRNSRNPRARELARALASAQAKALSGELTLAQHRAECGCILARAASDGAGASLTRGEYEAVRRDVEMQRDGQHGVAAVRERSSLAERQAGRDRRNFEERFDMTGYGDIMRTGAVDLRRDAEPFNAAMDEWRHRRR